MSKILKFNEFITEGIIPKVTLEYKPKKIVQLITEMEPRHGNMDNIVLLPICKDGNFPTVFIARGRDRWNNRQGLTYWFKFSIRADEETMKAFNVITKEVVGDTFFTNDDVEKGKLEEVLNRLTGIKTAKKGKSLPNT